MMLWWGGTVCSWTGGGQMVLLKGALGSIVENHCVLVALLHDGQLGHLNKLMLATHQKVQLSCLHHQYILRARQPITNTPNTLLFLLLTDQIR